MKLLDLPEEILILILKKLDIKSIKALYETCHHLKYIICMRNVIKECNFSFSNLATAQSLTTQFFRDIGGHLRELNLCGIQDICKTSLLQAMRKLKVIKSLNVAHTKICVNDLLDINHVCPSVVNVTINLAFSKTIEDCAVHAILLPKQLETNIQNMFKNFKKVHFVCDRNSIMNKMIFVLLKGAHLHKLMCTNTNSQLTKLVPENEDVDITSVSECLDLRFYECRGVNVVKNIFKPEINLENKDYIIIRLAVSTGGFSYEVHCSQSFYAFFLDNFGIPTYTDTAETMIHMQKSAYNSKYYSYDVLIMIWNKKITEFSDGLLDHLYKKMELLFPSNYLPTPRNLQQRHTRNWVLITNHDAVCKGLECEAKFLLPPFKKMRIAPSSFTLDCDIVCKDRKNIALSIHFRAQSTIFPVALSTNSLFLKEITHLTLTGSGNAVYAVGFFNVLLRSCIKLETMYIELSKASASVVTSFAKCLPLSTSLKNLRLIDDFINFTTLFSSLSQCKTLENIHIEEKAKLESFDLPDPKIIFVNCTNLYNFTICGPFTANTLLSKLRTLKKLRKTMVLHGLHIALYSTKDTTYAMRVKENLVHLSVFNPVPICQEMLPI